MADSYPATLPQRDRWIVERRGPKAALDAMRPYAFLWEEEADANGQPIPTVTIFLTNRECPFRCLMCDLWRNTLDARVPVGAITAQIRHALAHLPTARTIKLYNAGSFFDPQAIPPEEDRETAEAIAGFDRVIVECHPSFLRGKHGARALHFQSRLRGQLEIAIGLETVHRPTLARLNKRMTVESFRQAASFLTQHSIDLRVFVLMRPPFQTESAGVNWACRSLDVAAECGTKVCSIIPTRGGNGAMEMLGEAYQPPNLSSLEAALEYGLSLNRFRVYADLWDVEKFFACDCSAARAARLAEMNRTQQIPAALICRYCATN